MTIEDLFSRLFVTMGGGMPWAVQFCMDKAELLEVFCSYEPSKRALFAARKRVDSQVIQEGEQTCRETLKEIETLLNQRQQQEAAEQKQITQRVVVLESDESEPEKHAPSLEVAYILKQVESQTQPFPQNSAPKSRANPSTGGLTV